MDVSHNPLGAPDARAWLAGSVEASAVAAADDVFAGLGACAPADLARRAEAGGLAPLLAWADAVALAGFDREPWAREAALRAVRAYTGRLGELMTAAAEGGWG